MVSCNQRPSKCLDTLSNWLQIDTMATICLPHNTTQTTKIEQGDYLLLCTDGIYDLIALTQWGFIDSDTHLTDWLNALKIKIYHSERQAYDNGTAVVIRFK